LVANSTTTPMKKTILTFGLICGAIMSIMMIATVPFHDRIGFDTRLVIGYTTMVLAFLLLLIGGFSHLNKLITDLGGLFLFLERLFFKLRNWDRKVLPDAREIHEAKINRLDVALATHCQNRLRCHSHDPMSPRFQKGKEWSVGE